MKLLIPLVVLMATATPMWAQSNASATSNSSSGSSVAAQTRSQSSLVFNNPSRTQSTVEYDGSYRLENVPGASAPAFSSGHPCGLSTSGGLVIVGAGLTGGGMRVDNACLLAQMGEKTAAMIMIAARDPAACEALRAAGRISPQSCGNRQQATQTQSTRSPSVAYVSCRMEGGAIRVRPKPNQRALAISQCKARLGY